MKRTTDGEDPRHRGNGGKGDHRDPDPARRLRGRRPRRRHLQRFEGEGEIVRRMEALSGILLQAAQHQPLQLARHLFRQRGRFLVDDRPAELQRRRAREGTPAREHLVEHHARGEDVGSVVGARSAHLLRGHVGDGADQIRQLRLRSLAIGSRGS